jgi:hypothetical protein
VLIVGAVGLASLEGYLFFMPSRFYCLCFGWVLFGFGSLKHLLVGFKLRSTLLRRTRSPTSQTHPKHKKQLGALGQLVPPRRGGFGFAAVSH